MKKDEKEIQIGLVGAGDWGKNILRNFNEIPQTRLLACCDIDPGALAFVKDQYPHVSLCSDLDVLLRAHTLDAVAVSSPAATHYQIAKKILDAGLHAFVEKPLAFTSREAATLREAAQGTGKILMVGHLMRYHPAVVWIRNWLKNEGIGRVFYATASRSNLGRIRKEESVLWSLGPHDLSIFVDLFQSDPLSVQAQGGCFHYPGIEDVVFATLHFPEGIVGHLHLSRLTPHKVRQLSLVGSEAMLFFDDMENREKVKIFHRGGKEEISYDSYGEAISLRFGDISLPRIEMAEPLRQECEHFAQCVSENREPDTGAQEGEQVVRILEALEESLKRGGQTVPLGTVVK